MYFNFPLKQKVIFPPPFPPPHNFPLAVKKICCSGFHSFLISVLFYLLLLWVPFLPHFCIVLFVVALGSIPSSFLYCFICCCSGFHSFLISVLFYLLLLWVSFLPHFCIVLFVVALGFIPSSFLYGFICCCSGFHSFLISVLFYLLLLWVPFLHHFCMVLFVVALDLILNMQPKFYTAH